MNPEEAAARCLLGDPVVDWAKKKGYEVCFERGEDGSITVIKRKEGDSRGLCYVQLTPRREEGPLDNAGAPAPAPEG